MRCRQFWLSAMGVGLLACGPRISVGDLGDGSTSQNGSGGTTQSESGAGGSGGTHVSTGTGGASGYGTGGVNLDAAAGSGGAQLDAGAGGSGTVGSATGGSGAGTYDAGSGSTGTGGTGSTGDLDACSPNDSFPEDGFYGANVLALDRATFQSDWANGTVTPYDFAAIANDNTPVRIRISLVSPHTPQTADADGATGPAWPNWWFSPNGDWRSTNQDTVNYTQLFETADFGRMDEMSFGFSGTGQALIEYFECGSSTPTRTKTISWSPQP